jgi:hypothetical protein
VSAILGATTRVATLTTVIALNGKISWAAACRQLVHVQILPTGLATLAASTKSAIGMVVIVVIGQIVVLRVLAVRVLHRMATVFATEIAMLVASTRLANGMAATAAISRTLVI